MWKLLVFVACWATLAIAQKSEEIKWVRRVKDYEGRRFNVTERAEINYDKQSMLMKADDLGLRRTPFYRADSLHDFSTGLLALKPLGSKRCFIGKVKKSFEETLDDLRGRSNNEIKLPNGRRTFEVNLEELLGDTGSEMLNQHCKGYSTYLAVEVTKNFDKYLDPFDWIRFPPLYCFYGPIDIWFPGDPIYRDGDIPRYLGDWQGPFGPFP